MTARARAALAGGFTLVETMVALGLLAVLSLLGYRGLATLLDTQQQVTEAAQRWGDVDRIFARLEADLRTAVPRSVRLGAAERPGLELARDSGGLLLAISRAGPEFTLDATSAGQRIAYRWRARPGGGGQLELLYWPALDNPGAPTEAYVLAEQLRDVSVRVLGTGGQWEDAWPRAPGDGIPRALDVRFQLDTGEWVDRLLVLK